MNMQSKKFHINSYPSSKYLAKLSQGLGCEMKSGDLNFQTNYPRGSFPHMLNNNNFGKDSYGRTFWNDEDVKNTLSGRMPFHRLSKGSYLESLGDGKGIWTNTDGKGSRPTFLFGRGVEKNNQGNVKRTDEYVKKSIVQDTRENEAVKMLPFSTFCEKPHVTSRYDAYDARSCQTHFSESDTSHRNLRVQGQRLTLHTRSRPTAIGLPSKKKASSKKKHPFSSTVLLQTEEPPLQIIEASDEVSKKPPVVSIEIEQERLEKANLARNDKIFERKGQQIEFRLPSAYVDVKQSPLTNRSNGHAYNGKTASSNANHVSTQEFPLFRTTYIVHQGSSYLNSEKKSFTVVFPDEIDKASSRQTSTSRSPTPGWTSPVQFSTLDLSLAYFTPENSPWTSPMSREDNVFHIKPEFLKN